MIIGSLVSNDSTIWIFWGKKYSILLVISFKVIPFLTNKTGSRESLKTHGENYSCSSSRNNKSSSSLTTVSFKLGSK